MIKTNESICSFIPAIIAKRDLVKAQIFLTFVFESNDKPAISATRKMLMELPRIKNLRLDWLIRTVSANTLGNRELHFFLLNQRVIGKVYSAKKYAGSKKRE